MSQGLGNPQVVIDNVAFPIIPNSFEETKSGTGNVKTVAVANGTVFEPVHTLDGEEAYGQFKFTLKTDNDNVPAVDEFLNPRLKERLVIVTLEDKSTRTYARAVIMTDPPKGFSADGVIELEWCSSPVA